MPNCRTQTSRNYSPHVKQLSSSNSTEQGCCASRTAARQRLRCTREQPGFRQVQPDLGRDPSRSPGDQRLSTDLTGGRRQRQGTGSNRLSTDQTWDKAQRQGSSSRPSADVRALILWTRPQRPPAKPRPDGAAAQRLSQQHAWASHDMIQVCSCSLLPAIAVCRVHAAPCDTHSNLASAMSCGQLSSAHRPLSAHLSRPTAFKRADAAVCLSRPQGSRGEIPAIPECQETPHSDPSGADPPQRPHTSMLSRTYWAPSKAMSRQQPFCSGSWLPAPLGPTHQPFLILGFITKIQ